MTSNRMVPRRREILAAIATGALASCQRSGKRRIAVIPKGLSHLFWQSVHAGAEAAALEKGVEIVWNGPPSETDYTGQLKILDTAITQRLDAIVLAPIDKTVMVNGVDRAARERIPVVIFDSGVDTESFVSQVSTDNYKAGELGAERLAQILGGKGTVAMVAVQPGGASTMLREQGFEDAVQKRFPKIKIVDKRFGMADFAKSLAVTENMLAAHPELDALFASNESSTVGAVQALKSRKSKVKLVGFDWSPSLLEDVKAGLVDSLIAQDPFRMGYLAVKTAVEKLDGITPQKMQNLMPRVVTKENLSDPEVDKQLHPDLDKYLKKAG